MTDPSSPPSQSGQSNQLVQLGKTNRQNRRSGQADSGAGSTVEIAAYRAARVDGGVAKAVPGQYLEQITGWGRGRA